MSLCQVAPLLVGVVAVSGCGSSSEPSPAGPSSGGATGGQAGAAGSFTPDGSDGSCVPFPAYCNGDELFAPGAYNCMVSTKCAHGCWSEPPLGPACIPPPHECPSPFRPSPDGDPRDCNGDPADGNETLVRSDPEHCGACGHSCLGRACIDGLCQPEQLAELEPGAIAMAADDAGLFVAATHSVVQIQKDGSGTAQLAQSEHEITALALSTDDVLWSSSWFENGDRGRLERAPRAGGPAETLLDIGREIEGIASVSDGVYVATDVDLRWLDGSAPGVAVVASLTLPITALAADDSGAYFVSSNDLIHFDPSTQTSVKLASPSNITSIAIDTDHVYFTNIETGTVNRIPRSGGAPAELATGRTLPRYLAADDDAIYWVEGDALFGAVIKAPKNGSPPIALYCRVGATAISMDAAYIYIHSLLGSTGTIVSIPK